MKNIKTQSQNSEGYQPSLDSHAAVAAQNDRVGEWSQNDGVGKNLKYVILSPKGVRIHNNNAVAESGRSMVEMLGVLAVIGVLSITSISGYQYAKQKAEANRIISGLSKAHVVVADIMHSGNEDIFLGVDDSITDLSIKVLEDGYGLGEYEPVVAACGVDSFDILLNKIPRNVCKFLVEEGAGSYSAVDVRNPNNKNYDLLCRELGGASVSCDSQTGYVQIAFAFDDIPVGEFELNCPANSSEQNGQCVCDWDYAMSDGVCVSCGRPSVCMECNIVNGQPKTTFKPKGTECTTAGITGQCNSTGQCVPTEGTPCSSGGSCPAGEFCNYGGYASWQESGNTPDVCQKIRSITTQINGKTYYYPTNGDIKSWCRPADGGINCVWGYLSAYGADDWCRAQGKRLLNFSEVEIGHTFYNKLGFNIWLKDGSRYGAVWFNGNSNLTGNIREDGYYDSGIPVCTD